MTNLIALATKSHLSPLERAKASYRPLQSVDVLVGLDREHTPERTTPMTNLADKIDALAESLEAAGVADGHNAAGKPIATAIRAKAKEKNDG